MMDMYETAIQNGRRYIANANGDQANNRMNQLKQYMDFYDKSGMRPNYSGISNASSFTAFDNNKAMEWAQSQLDGTPGQSHRQAPNFYGQQEQYTQPQLPQQQYVQPNYQQQENPYSARAQQLNQGNSMGGGMGGDVTNYLRKLMEGSRGFGGNSTPGVRG